MRRALVIAVGVVSLLAVGADQFVPERTTASSGSHHAAGGFRNPLIPPHEGGALRYWQSRLFGAEAWATYDPAEYRIPIDDPELADPLAASGEAAPRVTWLGQATALIQYRGVNVLTDPMLSEQAGPGPLFSVKRISPPGLRPDELPPIDVVVVSHDHYDHLDLPSVRALGERPVFVVPLGLRRWLEANAIAPSRVRELDWWQSTTLQVRSAAGDVPLRLTATPAQHVSGRGLFDRNRRLWASWAIRMDDFRLFFVGDTGYNDVQFKQIGARLGPFDCALLPIGSYAPRDFMAPVHVNPAEAVRIHLDVGSRRSLAIHWGTFFLSAEHPSAPPQQLSEATARAGLPNRDFQAVAVGETEVCSRPQASEVGGDNHSQ